MSSPHVLDSVGCSVCEKSWSRNEFLEKEEASCSPVSECQYCELYFCEGCFMRHECYGHKREIEECSYCGTAIFVDEKNKPALFDGDPFCTSCAYRQPWLNQQWDQKKAAGL